LEVFRRKTVDTLYGNLNPRFIDCDYSKEIYMITQNIEEQVRWQDLQVRSELDIVLEIAKKEGWEDCEVFGYGDMITQPQESKGWKLIPADSYKYSIPTQAIRRLHQIINAGVRVRGVIIADDERRKDPPSPPADPKVSLSAVRTVMSFIAKALLGGLIIVAGVIALVSFVAVVLIQLWPVILFGLIVLAVGGSEFDPKLVILVDDGRGRTVWVSLFTWYE